VTDVFGLENFGSIFGLVFTAYGFLAGFLGPWLSGIILDITDSDYTLVFWMFALFYLVAAGLITKVEPVFSQKADDTSGRKINPAHES
jgi:MFS transporter, OFA family, oxalate/formate antiporter